MHAHGSLVSKEDKQQREGNKKKKAAAIIIDLATGGLFLNGLTVEKQH